MTISLVGSKTFTHASTSAQSCSLTDLLDETGAAATLLPDDLVLINYGLASTVDRTQAEMLISGYTAVHTDLYQNDTNDANQQVQYKFMGSTPDTTVSIPASNATTAGCAVTIHAFRGVNLTTPLDVTPVTAGNINTGIADAGPITPVTPGAWIVACAVAAVAAGAVFTNPTGMSAVTNHFRSATITSTNNNCNVGCAIKTDWSSGAYNPAAFGGSTSTNTGSWTAVTLALRPAASNFIPNGDFSKGNTYWLLGNGTRDGSSGVMRVTSNGSAGSTYQVITGMVVGQQYDFVIDCVAKSAASGFSVSIPFAGGSVFETGTGTKTRRFTATATTMNLFLSAMSATAGEWSEYDNLSITAVPSTPVSINASVTTSVGRINNIGKRIAVTGSTAVGIGKGIGKNVTVTAATGVEAVKTMAKIIPISVAASVLVTAARAYLQSINVTVTTTVTRINGVAKSVSLTAGTAVAAVKNVGKRITVAGSTSVIVIKATAKRIDTNVAAGVAMAKATAKRIDLIAATGVTNVKAVGKRITVAGLTAVGIGKGIGKQIAVTANATVTRANAIVKAIDASVNTSVDQLRAIFKTVDTSVGTAVNTVKSITKDIVTNAITATVSIITVIGSVIGELIESFRWRPDRNPVFRARPTGSFIFKALARFKPWKPKE